MTDPAVTNPAFAKALTMLERAATDAGRLADELDRWLADLTAIAERAHTLGAA